MLYLQQMQIYMQRKQINRLKVVLAGQMKTNKWLAEQLGKNETTVSRWCTKEVQPTLVTLSRIADVLDLDIKELLNSSK